MISLRTKVRTQSLTSRSSADMFRSMTSRLLVVGELRAQIAFEYLVSRPHRKGIKHLDATRVLVPAQPLARPLDESLNVQALPLVRDHHGAHLLTALLIRYADHRHLRDRRVPHQDLLDLTRVDVETTPDDQVLLPVHDGDEPVGVLLSDVAGAKPAVDQRLRGHLRVVEVTGEHVVAADHDLAEPAVGEQLDPAVLYTSDAADDLLCVDLGGRRIIKKKK